MDLIERKDAITAIVRATDGASDNIRLVTALKKVAPAKVPVWTSVNEALPDLHDDVWEDGDEIVHYKVSDPVLCVYNGGEQTVAVYEIDGDVDFSGWVNCHDSSDLHTVTHWMPLPEPPKEET